MFLFLYNVMYIIILYIIIICNVIEKLDCPVNVSKYRKRKSCSSDDGNKLSVFK